MILDNYSIKKLSTMNNTWVEINVQKGKYILSVIRKKKKTNFEIDEKMFNDVKRYFWVKTIYPEGYFTYGFLT